MRKILLLIAFSICLIQVVNAQYVNIPDSNFVKYLISKYPTCFNSAKLMDTTCSTILAVTQLDMTAKKVANTTGIHYFKNLKQLYCDSNLVTKIDDLPYGITNISCKGGVLTNIDNLPNTVRTVDFRDNNIATINSLPNDLVELVVDDNKITSISYFAANLMDIYLRNNLLTNLPILPNGLFNLVCTNNNLTSLPNLPQGLLYLVCYNNQLTSIPSLPVSLRSFYCEHNQLTALPQLNNNLRFVDCSNNFITTLPVLTISLEEINCSSNLLTNLPVLISDTNLGNIKCHNNFITCLPQLPKNLRYLQIDTSKINCVPNKPSGYEYIPDAGWIFTQLSVADQNGNYLPNIPICSSPCTLPLKLLSFTAKLQTQNSVILNWQTTKEVNVSHFNIQRSNNGKDFTSIGKVNANGVSDYSFIDDKLPITTDKLSLNYRLEIVDKDGSKTYSTIQQITIKPQTPNIALLPNPAKDLVTIECAGTKELLIIDYLGRTIYKTMVNGQWTMVNTKQLTKGIYVVKAMMNNGDIKTEKLVIE